MAKRKKKEPASLARRILVEWVAPLAAEVVVLALAIHYLFFLAVVPTGSMVPTIREKSWLFVTRTPDPEETVERGDILVFESEELGKTLIKRVIGLPGDEVFIDDEGKLYINGDYRPEPYVENPSPEGGAWAVPEGSFLFLGDNRADSYDARYWQQPFIPAGEIEGKARFVLWPPGDFGPMPKFEDSREAA